MAFMDQEPEQFTRTRERTVTDDTVDDILGARTSHLPVLSQPTPGAALPPEFAMMVAMGQGKAGRDEAALAKAAIRIGERMGERAIYSFPAGGSRVEGPTVHLVEALAQQWGHLFYGVRIESIEGDRVVIMGLCADAITGTVAARPAMFTLPPPPAKFAQKQDQASRWESMQVQNAISKATRGVLQHALPRWYIDLAYEAADKARRNELTDKDGNPLTLEQAIDQVVAAFGKQNVPMDGLEAFVGSPRALWVLSDLFGLRKAFHDLRSGTLSREAFQPKSTEPTATGGASALGGRPAPKPEPKPEPAKEAPRAAPKPEAAPDKPAPKPAVAGSDDMP